MTVQEAASKIEVLIRERGGGVSFVELSSLLGEEAEGDNWFGNGDYNIWWWFGMSDLFVEALVSLRPVIEPTATTFLVYAADGAIPRMPLAKRATRYKKPHWLPTVWNLRVERREVA